MLIGSLVCYPSLDSNSLIQNPYPIVRYLYPPPSTFIPFHIFCNPSPPSPVLIVHSHPPSQTSPTTTLSFVLPFPSKKYSPALPFPSLLPGLNMDGWKRLSILLISFIYSLLWNYSFIHSFIHSFILIIHSLFIHSIYSFIHSFIHSFIMNYYYYYYYYLLLLLLLLLFIFLFIYCFSFKRGIYY